MSTAAKIVLQHLDLKQNHEGTFSNVHKSEGWRQVFGGQLMAQAIRAASNTVASEKKLVSFQAMFTAPGDVAKALTYKVENLREGKSFSMRQVVASQEGNVCFQAAASFQLDEDGLDYQIQMPDVAPPDACADLPEIASAYRKLYPGHLSKEDSSKPQPAPPVEMRFVDIDQLLQPSEEAVDQSIWIRFAADAGSDQERHKQVLAYASDQAISHIVAQPQGLGGFNPRLTLVSLDHAMWFHKSFRADDWLLLVRRCQSTSSGRALVTGEVFNDEGVLVASLAQQALIRLLS